ncbi:NUDIX domain-containing protein [Allosaccharopolyspora coralli]|uniref:NUDIX domain-containing protein n=1 Tax=Allosaccharopolyspora coralli TaxID=2665642 RepID=A0A5Q3QGD0_9PSEU|nr:NUDIX hydrolase [Allosaccharopolyspora coralli]QGK72294.1 NUDIX domain-containing protein [Allosaccharopolyspora coralli]
MVSSEDVHVGKILALRVDEVAMPGGETARREVVEHPGAVAVVALDEQDHVVLIHQYRYPLGRRLWEIPAGLLDVDGETPAAAARRELAEEVGIAAAEWSVLVDLASSAGFTDQSERVFLARELSDVSRSSPVGDEEADMVVTRVPLQEAVRGVHAGEIVNAATVAGLLAADAVCRGHVSPRPIDTEWRDRPHRFAQRRPENALGNWHFCP